MSAWHDHTGTACPTHPEAMVRLRYRGVNGKHFESRFEYPAERLRWTKRGEPGDIIGYLVTQAPKDPEE